MKKYITIICSTAFLVACRVEKTPSDGTNEKNTPDSCSACHAKKAAANAQQDYFNITTQFLLLQFIHEKDYEKAQNHAWMMLYGITNDAQGKLEQGQYPEEAGARIEEKLKKARELLSEVRDDLTIKKFDGGEYKDTYKGIEQRVDWSK